MCGEPPAPMSEEELATVLMRLIERKGIIIDDNEAKNFIRKFKKEYKRFPDDKDLIRAAEEFVKVDSMSKQELKAKEMLAKKREKEVKGKGAVEVVSAAPARKETELDLSKKIEELRQKRALEKQQLLDKAKAKAAAPSKVETLPEEEAEIPEPRVESPQPVAAAPPHAPPIPSTTMKGKCPKCGASNPPDSLFCLECGEKIQGEAAPLITPTVKKGEVVCPKCKSSNPPGSAFCLECGEKMEAEVKSATAPVVSKGDTVCPGCKHVNPAGSRFCLDCGNPL